VRTPSTSRPFSKSPSMASIPCSLASSVDITGTNKYESIDKPRYETKDAYYSAGSGIPEVKVILGGFVIKGFLGIKTLIVKSIGMVMLFTSNLYYTLYILIHSVYNRFSLHQLDSLVERKVPLFTWHVLQGTLYVDCFPSLIKTKVS
jgi:hypothetical protein